MADTHSDALVFFGATGDLAYKKIFPALQAMAKRGDLDVPVIGVAKAGWTLDQLRARARGQRREVRRPRPRRRSTSCPACFATSTGTTKIRRPSRRSGRRSAAPSTRRTTWRSLPHSSGPSWSSWRNPAVRKGRASSSRSPSARTLPSARDLNRILLGTFVEQRHLPHRPLPRQATRSQHAVRSLHESDPGGVLESCPCRERADHDGRRLRHPGPRRLLRRDGRHSRRRPESPVPGVEQPRDGAAGEARQRVPAGRKGEGPESPFPLSRRRTSSLDNSAATATSVASLPIRRSRPTRRSGFASIRGGGRASRSTSAQASASR